MPHQVNPGGLIRRTEAGIVRADGERTYTLSFSSETPDMRWRQAEILDHAEGAADLTRLNEMGVVLFNHDKNRVIGRVENARVENGRGVAEIVFDADEESEIIRQKVESGTLKGVSLTARIGAIEEVPAGRESADGRFAGPSKVVRRWTAMEISIVSVPADATVGVGRSEEFEPINAEKEGVVMPEVTNLPENANATVPETERQAMPTIDTKALIDDERTRHADIIEICREAGLNASEIIRAGTPLEDVLRKANAALIANHAPLNVTVQRDEGDKYRVAAADALLMRGGLAVENAADGARELRNLSLREMAIETLVMDGNADVRRMDNDRLLMELQRAYFSPTASFPAILDQTVEKAYRNGYDSTPHTFERWTSKGTLKDFKVSKGYYIAGAAGDFLHVPEGGELKHDIPRDHARPGRKLETYGRQFTLTREAFINDDIGYITTIPKRYAAAARRTINKQVYSVLTSNPVVYDGEKLFGNEHGNDFPASAPTNENILEMVNKMLLMKDDDGEPISIVPRFILAPVGIASKIEQIVGAATVIVTVNGEVTTQNNPLASKSLTVIEDPYLNVNADAKAWYMIADPNTYPMIQVDYLNGNEIPSIRRTEPAGQLGFVWDIWLDWGVTAMEYRGAIRNLGA